MIKQLALLTAGIGGLFLTSKFIAKQDNKHAAAFAGSVALSVILISAAAIDDDINKLIKKS